MVAKKVKLYKDLQTPLFHKFKVEQHIEKMMFPKVELPSGGTLVINHTEALVAIDVNSGRSTKERNIEVTALKTNLEAAQEIGRQLRLRDLAGLLVIDFIDMDDHKYIQQVEQKLRESVKLDRARIQIGRISQFGLLELSRQRLRPSLMENHTSPCAHCHGTGIIRSTESLALQVLRAIEREAIKGNSCEIQVSVPKGTDLYLLNQKRREIIQIENRFDTSIYVVRENISVTPFYRIDVLKQKETPIISKEITTLKNQVERMEEKLDAILQKLDDNIIKNCDKMGDHIDFVNNVYDTVKVPLHYISNKVQKMIGNARNHDDARVSNKIEDSNNAINDDEYLFTENE